MASGKKLIAIAAVAILIVAGAAYVLLGMNNDSKPVDTDGDVDFAGYAVDPVENLDGGIVCLGQDTFRWVTYFGLADKCVMVDLNDGSNYLGKTFMYVGKTAALNNSVNGELKIGSENCSITAKDVETVIKLSPSVVVVPADFEKEHINEMNALRAAGLNIVHIGYIYTFLEAGTFEMSADMDKQIDVMAKVFNLQDRGNELKDLINSTVKDIRSIASGVKEKKTAYVGAIAYNGAHGIESSLPYYMPMALANIDNIMSYDTMSGTGSDVRTYSADAISAHMKSDTVLLLDATGIYQCTDATSLGLLQLFAGHESYIACPYIWTGIGYINVLISAYQLLMDVYGLLTEDQFSTKVDALVAGFLGNADSTRSQVDKGLAVPAEGTSVYDDMSAVFDNRRGNGIHGELKIGTDGAISYL